MPGKTLLGKTLLENLGPFILVWKSLSVVVLCLLSGLGYVTDLHVAGTVASVMFPCAILVLWQLERTFVATGMVSLTDPDPEIVPAE